MYNPGKYVNREFMKVRKKCIKRIFFLFILVFFPFCRGTTIPDSNPEIKTEKVRIELSCVLESGENIDYILQEMAIESNERYKITECLKEYLDMRSCMPGDSIIVFKDLDENFLKLDYVKNIFMRFTVTKIDTFYKAEKIEIPPSIAISTITGTVSSSLYETFLGIGESHELVFDYADIFAWVIDFLTEVQNGDTFEIIVEREFFKNNFIRNKRIIAASYKGEIGTYYAFYFMDLDGKEDYYDEVGNSLRKQLLKTPLQYRRISSYFSLRRLHPILKVRRPHYGVDFAAPNGTPISSVGDGHVVFAGWKGGYGKLVVINHPNSFKTYYGHLSRIKKGIVAGAKVKQGEVIGNVGSTGLSTGPHLHFGIKKYGKWINPLKVDLPPADPISEKYKELYLEEMEKLKLGMLFFCCFKPRPL